MLRKAMCVVLLCCAAYARVAPRVSYDRTEAWVTLPVSLSTNMESFVSMGEQVVRAVAQESVAVELKAYVRERTSLRERMHLQAATQRLERRLYTALPGLRVATSSVEVIPEADWLPAWRISTARTVPQGYVAIVLRPVEHKEHEHA